MQVRTWADCIGFVGGKGAETAVLFKFSDEEFCAHFDLQSFG
jgi:hypothetical protein